MYVRWPGKKNRRNGGPLILSFSRCTESKPKVEIRRLAAVQVLRVAANSERGGRWFAAQRSKKRCFSEQSGRSFRFWIIWTIVAITSGYKVTAINSRWCSIIRNSDYALEYRRSIFRTTIGFSGGHLQVNYIGCQMKAKLRKIVIYLQIFPSGNSCGARVRGSMRLCSSPKGVRIDRRYAYRFGGSLFNRC